MKKSRAQLLFLSRVRPVICMGRRLYACADDLKPYWNDLEGPIRYRGGKGLKTNAFHFDGKARDLPFPAVSGEELEILSERLSVVPDSVSEEAAVKALDALRGVE